MRGGLLCNRAVRSCPAELNPRRDRNEVEIRAGHEDVVEPALHEHTHAGRLDVESGTGVDSKLGVRDGAADIGLRLDVVDAASADQVGTELGLRGYLELIHDVPGAVDDLVLASTA